MNERSRTLRSGTCKRSELADPSPERGQSELVPDNEAEVGIAADKPGAVRLLSSLTNAKLQVLIQEEEHRAAYAALETRYCQLTASLNILTLSTIQAELAGPILS